MYVFTFCKIGLAKAIVKTEQNWSSVSLFLKNKIYVENVLGCTATQMQENHCLTD